MARNRFIRSLDRIFATNQTEIDCEQFQSGLAAYVEFEINHGNASAQFPAFAAHLVQCPDCADEYAGLHEIVLLETEGRLARAEQTLAQFPQTKPEPLETEPELQPDLIPASGR